MAHLRAPLNYQRKCARFVENHDEKRIAAVHRGGDRGAHAAAVIATTVPGLRFIHDGQLQGRKLHHSLHLRPRVSEPADLDTVTFYKHLLSILHIHEFRSGGRWHQAIVTPSRDGNDSWRNIVAYFVTPAPGMHVQAASERAAVNAGGSTALPAGPSHSQSSSGDVAGSSSGSTVRSAPETRVSDAIERSASDSSSQLSTALQQEAPPTATSAAASHAPTSSTTGGHVARDFRPLVVAGGAPAQPAAAAAVAIGPDTSAAVVAALAAAVATTFPAASAAPSPATSVISPILSTPAVASTPCVAVPGGAGTGSGAVGRDPEDVVAGRTFLVLVNYSDRPSNGHVLFNRADESAYASPECTASASHVASLVKGFAGQLGVMLEQIGPSASSSDSAALVPPPSLQIQIPASSSSASSSSLASTSSRTDATSSAATAPPLLVGGLPGLPWVSQPAPPTAAPTTCRRIGLVDHLSPCAKEYPSSQLASEGWWVQLDPWRAQVLEMLQLPDD